MIISIFTFISKTMDKIFIIVAILKVVKSTLDIELRVS